MTTGQQPRPPQQSSGPGRPTSGPGGGGPPRQGYQRPGGGGPPQRRRGGRPRYYARRKLCAFCVDHIKEIDYKKVDRLRRFLSDRSRIESRRKTGVCSKHQRALSTAIKRARLLAMLPFSPAHTIPGGGGFVS